ncbi:hypothetical protein BpHYR1_054007 [Brachionus plicatilis]|uniref:Uncharacterized protein n=1 Tax=Brachionus plicatilis TaxID=10195 RepID=A0A3M7PU85_BRAPC|nr:hypothetical protein BpHYR1_054007 [Brachionus plicatilis]
MHQTNSGLGLDLRLVTFKRLWKSTCQIDTVILSIIKIFKTSNKKIGTNILKSNINFNPEELFVVFEASVVVVASGASVAKASESCVMASTAESSVVSPFTDKSLKKEKKMTFET